MLTAIPQENGNSLRHKDIFKEYILPQISVSSRIDWDSQSDKDEGEVENVDQCRAKCEADPDCRQYSFHDDGICVTRVDPRLGLAADGFTSGWLYDRMVQFERDMAPCDDESWLT